MLQGKFSDGVLPTKVDISKILTGADMALTMGW